MSHRHCEERSDEAIHSSFCCSMDCFAALAMTALERFRSPGGAQRNPGTVSRRRMLPRIALRSIRATGFRGYDDAVCYFPSSKIIAAPFSAIIAVGVFVFPEVIVGITEASATRSPAMP